MVFLFSIIFFFANLAVVAGHTANHILKQAVRKASQGSGIVARDWRLRGGSTEEE